MFKYLPIILFLYFFSAFNVLANQTSLQLLIEGTEYCKNKQYEKGIELNSNALLFAETEEGPNSWNVAKILKGLGQCYLEKGDRSLALPLYMRALEIAENIWGNDHENVQTILYQMGRLYLLSENSAEADKYLTRSYNIFKKNPSKDLLVEGYFLYYLGEVRTIECRYSQAEVILKAVPLMF
jgi:tetratricopeptide (TPR) repeat protein